MASYDLSPANYDNTSFDVSSEVANARAISWKPDGTKFFILDNSDEEVYEYTCSSPYDLSTASYNNASYNTDAIGIQEDLPHGMFFRDDGTEFFICGGNEDKVQKYDLITAWDISTASYSGDEFSLNGNPQSLWFKPDGTEMYATDQINDNVEQYTLTSAWDITTASSTNTYDVFSEVVNETPTHASFSDDGTKMFVVDDAGTVYEYDLSTAWDVTSASYNSVSLDVSSEESSPQGLDWRKDSGNEGSKLYIIGLTETVYQYGLTTIFPDDWNRRGQAQQDGTLISSDENDFPFYIDLGNLPADFWNNVQSDGGDIRVSTDQDGNTQLPLEVVSIDTTAETGEIHFKEDADSVQGNTVYVWYDGPSGSTQPNNTDTYGRNNVWTKYNAVYHMDSSSPSLDSTGNGHDFLSNEGTTATGKVEGALNFDGTSQSNQIPAGSHFATENLTVSFWMRPDSVSGGRQSILYETFNIFVELDQNGGSDISFLLYDNLSNFHRIYTTTSLTNDQWFHIAGTHDGSSQVLYLDGSSDNTGSDTFTNGRNNTEDLYLASEADSEQWYDGDVDELRYSPNDLGSGWISTEYDMQNDNATFWTFQNFGTVSQSFTRTVTDTVNTADAITKQPKIVVQDTTNTAENVAKTFDGTRTITDAITTAEDVTKQPQITTTDSVTTTDAVTKQPRVTIKDAVTTTEATTATATFTRTVTETVSTAETINKQVNIAVTDAVTTTDTATTTFIVTVTVTDSVTTTDAVTKQPRVTITDSVTTVENLETDFTFTRTITDAVTTTENINTQTVILRTVTDSVTTTDAVTKQPQPVVSDSVTTAETIQRDATLTRTITDAVSTSDDVNAVTLTSSNLDADKGIDIKRTFDVNIGERSP